MEILTEFDELQAALAKVNMDESVFPYVNGRLVENVTAFNKTQKILNCPEMISAHKFLYELDMDQLSEDDVTKIDQLYKLGCDRGFIDDDIVDYDNDEGDEVEQDVEVADVAPAEPKNTLFKAKIPCWTVIYSAVKDGNVKTGEAYSNAVSMSAAKADVNAKLSQCGYDNITILAIENCVDAPPAYAANTVEVSEDDDSKDDDSDDSSKETEDTPPDVDNDDSDDSEEKEPADDAETDDDSGKDEGDKQANDSDDAADEPDENGDSNDSDEDSSEDDENSDDTNDEPAEDSDEDSDDSDDDSDDSDEDSDDELDANQKAELKNQYRKIFKNTLVKCKFDTSFNDLDLEQKVKFFTELVKAWKKDNEPKEFMTDKEIEQLNNVVADVPANDSNEELDDSDDDSGDSDED